MTNHEREGLDLLRRAAPLLVVVMGRSRKEVQLASEISRWFREDVLRCAGVVASPPRPVSQADGCSTEDDSVSLLQLVQLAHARLDGITNDALWHHNNMADKDLQDMLGFAIASTAYVDTHARIAAGHRARLEAGIAALTERVQAIESRIESIDQAKIATTEQLRVLAEAMTPHVIEAMRSRFHA